MDECLRVGGADTTAGISLVVNSMWEHLLHARTATFNALLRRYAASGDSESAFNLAVHVMGRHPQTAPNAESWTLLLQTCMQSTRGRYD